MKLLKSLEFQSDIEFLREKSLITEKSMAESQSFASFGLHDSLMRAISEMGYETPTPIQTQAIPLVLAGHDVMGAAQTGTGKTASFGLPLLERLIISANKRM